MAILEKGGSILTTLFVEKVLAPKSGSKLEGKTDKMFTSQIIFLKVILNPC